MGILTDAQKTALNNADPNTLADEFRSLGLGTKMEAALAKLPYISDEITGTGVAVDLAHGKGAAPTKAVFMPTHVPDNGYGAGEPFTFTVNDKDATNINYTLTSGVKGYIVAEF